MRKSIAALTVFLLVSSLLPAIAEDNLEKHLGLFRQSQGKVLAEIEKAQKESTALAAAISEVNRLEKLAGKHKKEEAKAQRTKAKATTILDAVQKNYGLALLSISAFYDFDFDKGSKKQLEEVLAKARGAYVASMDCFADGQVSAIQPCQQFSNFCDVYGYQDGKMYVLELTKELEKNKVDVTERDPVIKVDSWFESFPTGLYQFCKLRGMLSPYQVKKPRQNTAFLIENYYGETILPYGNIFKAKCLDAAPSPERQAKFRQLSAEFPEALSDANERYQSWKKNCQSAAWQTCSNTYVVKDQVILSYATRGCEIRDVTKEDIQSDMEMFSTNAEKLNHSTLLDDIEVCQQAHNAGFFWVYQKPALAESCTQSKKKPKKKK